MKTSFKILSCIALAILLMLPSLAAATHFVNLIPGTEKWFSLVGPGNTPTVQNAHNGLHLSQVVSTRCSGRSWMGSQVISVEDRLFNYNTEGDIFYHGTLQDEVFETPILWVDAPLTVGKTWKETRLIAEGPDNTGGLVHYVFAVLEEGRIACPAGSFLCYRVFLTEIYPDGDIKNSCFWFNDDCGMIQCTMEDNSFYKLVKVIPGDNIDDNENEIDNPVQDKGLAFDVKSVPNPANPMTSITFELKEAAEVQVSVYDISGRLVKRLVQGEFMSAGPVAIRWQGTDDQGRQWLQENILFRVKAGQTFYTNSFTLVR